MQFFHRTVAGILLFLAIWLVVKLKNKQQSLKTAGYVILGLISSQYVLGILTIIGIIGNKTPVFLGVAHQGLALIFLASLFYLFFRLNGAKK